LSCTSNSKSGGGFLAGAKEVPDYEYYIDPGHCRYSDVHLSVRKNRTDQQRNNDDDGKQKWEPSFEHESGPKDAENDRCAQGGEEPPVRLS
jgi:hypothetical protein